MVGRRGENTEARSFPSSAACTREGDDTMFPILSRGENKPSPVFADNAYSERSAGGGEQQGEEEGEHRRVEQWVEWEGGNPLPPPIPTEEAFLGGGEGGECGVVSSRAAPNQVKYGMILCWSKPSTIGTSLAKSATYRPLTNTTGKSSHWVTYSLPPPLTLHPVVTNAPGLIYYGDEEHCPLIVPPLNTAESTPCTVYKQLC